MSTATPEPEKKVLPKILEEHVHPSTPLDDVPIPAPEDKILGQKLLVVRVGAWAYLRTMWSLLWTALRHPMTTTFIDARTGKLLRPRKK